MLLEFYCKKCPYCQNMEPLVKKLKKEEGVEVSQLEVWHNKKNAREMERYDKGLCGGIPFFYNTNTYDYICGQTSYTDLKKLSNIRDYKSKH